MPNTTNALDGGVFSHLKKLIKLHQGLAKKRKVKLIDEFWINIIKNDNSASRFFHYARICASMERFWDSRSLKRKRRSCKFIVSSNDTFVIGYWVYREWYIQQLHSQVMYSSDH
jgi:hypothetical protein